jgi:hypothetical protein
LKDRFGEIPGENAFNRHISHCFDRRCSSNEQKLEDDLGCMVTQALVMALVVALVVALAGSGDGVGFGFGFGFSRGA